MVKYAMLIGGRFVPDHTAFGALMGRESAEGEKTIYGESGHVAGRVAFDRQFLRELNGRVYQDGCLHKR